MTVCNFGHLFTIAVYCAVSHINATCRIPLAREVVAIQVVEGTLEFDAPDGGEGEKCLERRDCCRGEEPVIYDRHSVDVREGEGADR
jgi:hypothetical protein